MGLLARITDFVAGTAIVSNTVDQEFNQLVNVLNGTSTDKNLLVKLTDAGNPPLKVDQLGSGTIQEWSQRGVLRASLNHAGQFVSALSTGTAPFSITSTTQVNNLNPDRVGGILATNIAKLDTHKTAFTVVWFYPVQPAATETTESVPRFIVPAGVEFTAIDLISVWVGGSASGGSNSYTFNRRNSAGVDQGTGLAFIDISAGSQNVLQVANISDLPVSTGDQIYPRMTVRNTASETLVTVGIRFTQKLTT